MSDTAAIIAAVRRQYERFPYPPLGMLALPQRRQGAGLRYEAGLVLAQAHGRSTGMAVDHAGMRILVVGGGTLEPLVVAQMHPRAAEIVALDISAASLSRLRQRYRWAKVRDGLHLASLRGQRLPPLRIVQADMMDWREEGFDYILASNVLHHLPDPAAALARLATMLRPQGMLRLVTYAAHSRFWLRATGDWLRWHGITADVPGLRARAAAVIDSLPSVHPIRSCFQAHGETATATGIVDAFLHVWERPLAPLQWASAAAAAGLAWLGETQAETSRGEFLVELLPPTAALDPWQRLQVLDDTLELAANPVWWFRRDEPGDYAMPTAAASSVTGREDQLWAGVSIDRVMNELHHPWRLPSRLYGELGDALRRADTLLSTVGTCLADWVAVLRREVGPRLARDGGELLGLTIGEHDVAAILATPRPWQHAEWSALAQRCQGLQLRCDGEVVPGDTLAAQAEWLQCCRGADEAEMMVELRR